MTRLRLDVTPQERFWPKTTHVTHGGLDCVVWTGGLATNGYGRFWLGGRGVPAHRFAWEMVNGPVPTGLQLDHLCRTRACVNPEHLEPVTSRENVLRGVSRSAINATKTHCIHGHSLADAYCRTRRSGGRNCRTCLRLSVQRRRAAAAR